jgi:lysine 2,3-aminomutase
MARMTHQDHRIQNTGATSPEALALEGLVSDADAEELQDLARRYAISAPRHLVDLIDKGAESDPIALQIVPSLQELITTDDERVDPIGDNTHSPLKGLVHRYPDRVLLKVHSACAMYCRFCFRREMVGPGGDMMTDTDITEALNYIRNHTEIWEVILTGGDPMMLSARRISMFLDALDCIEHVKVVRFHTRLPVAAPERVTKDLITALSNRRATIYVAVHSNHAREFSAEALAACQRLTDVGIPLVGQTVLLKGINDNAEVLADLFRTMVEARIMPYYLHHPDLAPGTSHFRVSIETGQDLMKQLRGHISGLAIPTYILDIPGGYGKVPVGPSYISDSEDGALEIQDINGQSHIYQPQKSNAL